MVGGLELGVVVEECVVCGGCGEGVEGWGLGLGWEESLWWGGEEKG